MCGVTPRAKPYQLALLIKKSCGDFWVFFSRSWIGLPSEFCVCNSHKLCKLVQGKFAVGQGKQGI